MFFLVPMAYDYIKEGINGGTIERCNTLLKKAFELLLKTSSSRVHFVSVAGYSKDHRSTKTKEIPESLSEQMIAYCKKHLYTATYAKPQAWGTYEEIRDALEYIKYVTGFGTETYHEVYFSTNRGHSFRVKLCIFFLSRELGLKKPNWKFKVLIAKHSFSKKEWFQETGKFFIYLYKFLFKKW